MELGRPRPPVVLRCSEAVVSDLCEPVLTPTTMSPYAYPDGNNALVESLKLLKHPEGGYVLYEPSVIIIRTASSS
jgi:hypothetical protein